MHGVGIGYFILSSARLKPPRRFMYWRQVRFLFTFALPNSFPSTSVFWCQNVVKLSPLWSQSPQSPSSPPWQRCPRPHPHLERVLPPPLPPLLNVSNERLSSPFGTILVPSSRNTTPLALSSSRLRLASSIAQRSSVRGGDLDLDLDRLPPPPPRRP